MVAGGTDPQPVDHLTGWPAEDKRNEERSLALKIVIVGNGKVGFSLAEQLVREKYDVVIVDMREDTLRRAADALDIMSVKGNGISAATLIEAGVPEADLMVAATNSDEINMVCCLTAKHLGAKYAIARIRNPEYETQLRFMRGELGLTMSINPEKAAAHEIARVLRFPAAMKLESFSKGRLELVEYRLPEGSALNGVRLLDIYRNARARVLICAVSRKGQTTIPSGDFELKTGDKIYVTAAPDHLSAFFQYLGVFRKKASTVMIVGASKMCYYLADELMHMGMSVKIVDQNEARCAQMSEQLPRALVIMGDGTDSELLAEEGIDHTDAFVALTGLDEANILMAMCASRQTEQCKVVAKINRRSLMDLVSSEGIIDSVVSARDVTTELIVQYVRAMEGAAGSQIKTLHRLVEGAVEALEFHVDRDPDLVNVPLRELKLRSGVLIAGIVRRDGEIVIPGGNDTIRAGDDVIVVTQDTALQELRDILRQG